MDTLLKKLNYKDQYPVVVLNAPAEFAPAMKEFARSATVLDNASAAKGCTYAIAFVTTQAQVNMAAKALDKVLEGDAILWMCYPKGTSKRYSCDFNRDTGWQPLGDQGFEPVRQVAIDADWSALRFRRVQYIKKLTRNFAMTEEGKRKAGR
jgi:hypothetical protein